jgi:copper chaperone
MECVFTVPQVKCEGCVETITKALNGLAGVHATQVTIPAKEVRVDFDPAQLDDGRLRKALAEAGFPPE